MPRVGKGRNQNQDSGSTKRETDGEAGLDPMVVDERLVDHEVLRP